MTTVAIVGGGQDSAKGRTYRGLLMYGAEVVFRCEHTHTSRQSAQACADRALARRANGDERD